MDKLVSTPVSMKPSQQSYLSAQREVRVSDPDVLISETFSQKFNNFTQFMIPKNVAAKLICSQQHDGHWNLELTHIQGEEVAYLLGRTFDLEEIIPLDRLIPLHARAIHGQRVDSILNQEYESDYWDDFFIKMMNRDITILNIEDQTPRLVNVLMRLESSVANIKVFQVTLTDKTAENIIANKAGSMSHNLRSTFRSIINRVNESESDAILEMSREEFSSLSSGQLGLLYDRVFFQKLQNQERLKDISTMAYDGLGFCASTRNDFSATQIKKGEKSAEPNASNERLLIEPTLTDFIDKRRLGMPHINFSYTNTSTAFLESDKIDILKNFLWNLFLNASQAMQNASTLNPQITIQCFDHIEEGNTIFHCECSDTGPGMTELQCQTFFSRTFPIKSDTSIDKIEASRGEGSLMAYKQWKLNGGEAIVSSRTDEKLGVKFQLSCPAYSSRLFVKNSILSPEKIASLTMLSNNSELSGLILLVDDQQTIIKLQMKTIGSEIVGESFDLKKTQLSIVKNPDWAQQALTTDILGSWGIICAANGCIAYEIVKLCPDIKLVITDMEMPEMDGARLIHNIRSLEQENSQRPAIRIVLNTGLTQADSAEKVDFEQLSVEYMLKGADSVRLKSILSDIIQNKASEADRK